jgi:hypothetical protein
VAGHLAIVNAKVPDSFVANFSLSGDLTLVSNSLEESRIAGLDVSDSQKTGLQNNSIDLWVFLAYHLFVRHSGLSKEKLC